MSVLKVFRIADIFVIILLYLSGVGVYKFSKQFRSCLKICGTHGWYDASSTQSTHK